MLKVLPGFFIGWIIKCERRGGREELSDKLSDSNKQDLVILWVCMGVCISFLFFFLLEVNCFTNKLVLGLDSSEYSQLLQMPKYAENWVVSEILAWRQSQVCDYKVFLKS